MNVKRLKEIVAEPEEPEFTLPQDIDILNGKLSIEQQETILYVIFGFCIVSGNIYDEDGDEFYAFGRNTQYDLTTIGEIIIYAMDRAHELGYRNCQINAAKKLQEDAISYFKEQKQNI